MKKVLNKINFAIVGLMATASSAFAEGGTSSTDSALCGLVRELGGVLGTLRILAFIGAGFLIAGWAWDFIAKGDVKLDDVKKKGVGLLTGVILLFAIGTVLSFLIGAAKDGGSLGCKTDFGEW